MKISTKRLRSTGFILMTLAVLAAGPISADDTAAAFPACVAEPGTDVAIGDDPLAEAVPQALCVARAQCSTGGPVSCSGTKCTHLDWCYAWCDGVYTWCAPPPGIYCPLVN
jgi:hypothetical protein